MIKKIILCFLILFTGKQQFSYADSWGIEDIFWSFDFEQLLNLFLISIFVLIICIIYILILHIRKKQKNKVNTNIYENHNSIDFNFRENIVKIIVLVFGTIVFLFIFGLLVQSSFEEHIPIAIYSIPVFLIIASIIVRLNKNKKMSYILFFSSIALIGIFIICNILYHFGSGILAKNFNNKFLKYSNYSTEYQRDYVSDAQELLQEIKDSNRGLRKVEVIYQNKEYESKESLETLIKQFTANTEIFVDFIYDDDKYIETIRLSTLSDIYIFNKIPVTILNGVISNRR